MDVTDEELQARLNRSFFPYSEESCIRECDFILMCVPTPLIREKEPDLSYIKRCSETIGRFLRKGQFVILESTTYPGTTDEVVVPILERTGLKAGTDFGVAYSQERVDPGNKEYSVQNVPKVVGGIDPECTLVAAALYGSVIPTIIMVKDCRTAEACKLLENIFRSVNIALVNEMALTFEKMDIDIWEVIEAAATKPYGFMPFYPGPGIGGHCIPLDPYYLAYKARRYGVIPRFIELAGEINDFMRLHAVNLAEAGLKRIGKSFCNSSIAVVGLSYKKDIDDSREAPGKKVIEEIVGQGGKIKVYDPYVGEIETHVGSFKSEPSLAAALKDIDCAIFLVEHARFAGLKAEYFLHLMAHPPVVIDCKNIFKAQDMEGAVYLAIGKSNSRR
jgi:UDP-N-acetyl-D-glucosamine dehydrogenase